MVHIFSVKLMYSDLNIQGREGHDSAHFVQLTCEVDIRRQRLRITWAKDQIHLVLYFLYELFLLAIYLSRVKFYFQLREIVKTISLGNAPPFYKKTGGLFKDAILSGLETDKKVHTFLCHFTNNALVKLHAYSVM